MPTTTGSFVFFIGDLAAGHKRWDTLTLLLAAGRRCLLPLPCSPTSAHAFCCLVQPHRCAEHPFLTIPTGTAPTATPLLFRRRRACLQGGAEHTENASRGRAGHGVTSGRSRLGAGSAAAVALLLPTLPDICYRSACARLPPNLAVRFSRGGISSFAQNRWARKAWARLYSHYGVRKKRRFD